MNTADKPKRREFAQLRSGLGPVLLAALDNRSTVEIKLNADGKLWRERLGCPMWEIGSMDSRQAEALIHCVAAALFDP